MAAAPQRRLVPELRDTGQSRRVADFLLSHDAEECQDALGAFAEFADNDIVVIAATNGTGLLVGS